MNLGVLTQIIMAYGCKKLCLVSELCLYYD